ncbi:MAG: hypothetical protein H6631_03555 [Anaerolineaceae bacterium]|nr:hypothetical protein [Anaerolineaceae bacterium]
MSDEDVIPQSIGGDKRTIIRTHKSCNENAGKTIDTLIASDVWSRLNALYKGVPANRRNKLKGEVTLKDGRKLQGHFFFTQIKLDVFRPDFQPLKQQPDGTKWLSEEAVRGQSPPSHINILRREMIDTRSYIACPAKDSGMEPALIKILLGMIYFDQGPSVVSSPSFDVLRNCLSGQVDSLVTFQWLDSPIVTDGVTIKNHQHAVFYGCPDGKTFEASVILFGTGVTFRINEFGYRLPKQKHILDGRPLNSKVEILWTGVTKEEELNSRITFPCYMPSPNLETSGTAGFVEVTYKSKFVEFDIKGKKHQAVFTDHRLMKQVLGQFNLPDSAVIINSKSELIDFLKGGGFSNVIIDPVPGKSNHVCYSTDFIIENLMD